MNKIIILFLKYLRPVHVCKFVRSGYHVMTASDDTHVRLFDLATGSTVMKIKAHKVIRILFDSFHTNQTGIYS